MPNFALIKAISESPWSGEWIKETEKMKFQSLGADLTAEQMENCASIVAMRHAPELLQAVAVSEGRAPDLSGLAPEYLKKLERVKATDADVANAAQFAAPGLDRVAALKRWVEKGRKDATRTRPANASPGYDPNYDTPTEEDI